MTTKADKSLRSFREAKSLTIRELAGLTGLARSTLGDIETGKRIVNVVEAKAIAKELGCRATAVADASEAAAAAYRAAHPAKEKKAG